MINEDDDDEVDRVNVRLLLRNYNISVFTPHRETVSLSLHGCGMRSDNSSSRHNRKCQGYFSDTAYNPYKYKGHKRSHGFLCFLRAR